MTLYRHPQHATRWILCAATAASLVVLSGCKKSSDDAPEAVVTVAAERPEVGDISEHIIADATLAPLAQAAISPKITAPVRTFYVQRGSKVKAGQLLAVLENRDLVAQALDNKGQYTAAQATFDIQTKAQVPEDYAKANLDLEQAKAQLRLQGEIAASRRKLLEQGAIAGRDYDSAVAALTQAQSAYDIARNHLHSLSTVSNQATRKLAQGQLSSAQGKLNAAEAQVSYTHIQSPIAGVVTDRPLFPGETATTGTPLITVMDTSSLLAKVHLSQSVAQRLTMGDDASVSIPGVDQAVPGKISLISPALDPGSTTVEVWIKVNNAAGAYKAGTSAHVSVVGRTAPHAVKIPLAAVLTAEDGTKSVMIVNADGTAHKVSVQLGINDGEDVQVMQGLNGSQTVITQGAYGLSDGTKVTVGKPAAAGEDK
ncbi:efflux RND transporter periplasmic adaptor subunit [Granulicella cerasi]|uniref:Efflux RND transporter periplasmic adaptor subunit n=1 Tax=Granulicella cerasi TaxID=741063 RepID=A0ABW1Z7D2_9BACT|nr:efflux RND transporter periplasmic adaptor subunit [Granulicella cerasi]